MIINNQKIIETKTHLIIHLDQPYWGAYKQYGWKERVPGLGLSKGLVDKAKELDKKIMVKYQYGKFEITPDKAIRIHKKYNSTFVTRNKVILYEIPKNEFKRVGDIEPKEQEITQEDYKRSVEARLAAIKQIINK